MAPVKLKGICILLCGLGTLLLHGPSYLSPSTLFSIGSRPVTLLVNVPLTKRVVLACSAIHHAVKLFKNDKIAFSDLLKICPDLSTQDFFLQKLHVLKLHCPFCIYHPYIGLGKGTMKRLK